MPQDNLDKYRRQSHVTYDCRYHLVWVTKYRFRVIDPDVETALKWAIKEICDWKDIIIIEGAVKAEHVHLYLNIPPKYSISEVMQWLKGKSAERLLKKFPKLEKQYWGRHLWARGYFVSTVGISDEIIRQYIRKQRDEEMNDFNQKWKP
ncbi:IS200/IS605 family transposase [Candidatus Falkowbacteria bacterium]|nr:IS200/IS605 family transposase [Candidatus Falkowbacteria bacterium]